MSILTNLKQRPVLRASSSAEEGVVIHFSRKLPSDIVKKPRNITGNEPTLREKEAELPVEGAEGAAPAAATAGVFVVDKRHTADFDRDAIMAKIRGSRAGPGVIPLPPTKFVSGEPARAAAAEEAEPEMEGAPVVVKLGKRAILPSDEVVKQTKASAAIAIAEANEPADFEEIRPEEEKEEAPPAVGAEEAAVPKKRIIRPKPKGAAAAAAASGSVSAATVGVKAAVKKIKEREDSTVNIAAYKVGDTIVATRLPAPRPLPQVQASEFYMNNRAKFIQYINALFRP